MRRNTNSKNRSMKTGKTYRSKKKCERSGKIRYRTQNDATKVLSNLAFHAAQGFENRAEKRAYSCSSCAGWHLTSQQGRNASRLENAFNKYSKEQENWNRMMELDEEGKS